MENIALCVHMALRGSLESSESLESSVVREIHLESLVVQEIYRESSVVREVHLESAVVQKRYDDHHVRFDWHVVARYHLSSHGCRYS